MSFEINILAEIVRESKKIREIDQKVLYVIKKVKEVYDFIEEENGEFFVTNGSTFGSVKILYASLTEYLIIYTCPLKNSGITGRYSFSIKDIVISGEAKISEVSTIPVTTTYKEGEIFYLRPFQIKFYEMSENTIVLEYARGFIPYCFISFVMPQLLMTGDVFGVWSMSKCYFCEILRNMKNLRI